ncbi:MFS transporter [Streptacidiphilus griseoplanus]|uniref:MFS transporter n=1 Tax=Peterkaempfera griseoplana TaxID=66896 RepID=UPI00099F0CD5|nr:MFS transporter [Peterkaempfera griseoplana]
MTTHDQPSVAEPPTPAGQTEAAGPVDQVTPSTPPAPAAPSPGPGRAGSLALAVIVTCQLMVAVDGNIVNIALPSIQSGLNFSSSGLAWVFSAYSLAFGGLLLLGGRAGDILGRRRMFVRGLLVVVAASLLGGLAPNPALLIAARAAQGIGFAFAAPAALSLIAVTFRDGPERNRALGVFSTVAGLGITIGLILGGLLTTLSWRLVFFVNVPIGLAAVVLATRLLPETDKHPSRPDVIGALTSTAGMTAVVYGLINASSAGWSSVTTVLALAIGVLLLIAFTITQTRVRQPLIPLRLFAQRARPGAYAIFLLLFATMGGTYFLLSLYVQNGLGLHPLATGLAFLPMALAQFATARSAPKLIPKYGAKALIVTGSALMLADSLWLTATGPHSSYPTGLLGPLVLLGAGLGLGFVPLNMTILAGLAPKEIGAASGLLQAVQQIGLSLGVAVLATLYSNSLHGGTQHPDRAQLAHGLAGAVAAAAAFSALAVLLGHTRDDQAETVLLGLARGSGARSLAGMPPAAGRYRRPLLEVDRAATRQACAAQGVAVWDDPHNTDPAFTRSRVRHEVLPVLEKHLGGGVVEALARTARLFRDDADALDVWADQVERELRDPADPEGPLDAGRLAELPAAVRRRVLRRAAVRAGSPPGDLFARHVEAVEQLVTGWRGQGPLHLPGGVEARRRCGSLFFRTQTPNA